MGDAAEDLEHREEMLMHLGYPSEVGPRMEGQMELVGTRVHPLESGLPTSGLMLVVGHPKSGKTWFASSFPNSYLLELEKGGADRVPGGRIHEIPDLETFGNALELVVAESGIKTIVIDSIDELATWIEKDVEKLKPRDKDGWAFWGEFRERIEGLVNFLKESNKLIILIAHCKPPEKSNEGRVITPAGINVSGKGGAYIAAQAEMIGYVSKKNIGGKGVHFLSFRSESDLAIWGSRVEELADKEIQLSKSDPYGSFAAIFGEPKKPAAPVTLAAKTVVIAARRKK
jgi:AAA domain